MLLLFIGCKRNFLGSLCHSCLLDTLMMILTPSLVDGGQS